MKGSKVRDLRRALRLTQGQFAKEVGVHQTTVARWETDRVKPSPEAVARIKELSKRAKRG